MGTDDGGNYYYSSSSYYYYYNGDDDNNVCTLVNGICDSGTCQGCPVLTDDCEIAAGTFDAVTQQCSAPTVKADGATCDLETTDG